MSKARNLADLLSDGAELADGQISVAEVVGAAPLASPTFTGTASGTFSGPLTGNVTGNLTGDVTAPEIDLSAISATISDTAVDIFVYDTRKDSDGGAWRKRTQHTSWYNETLSTSTRGSRKEFPAVAVIVGTADDLFIYDGDDPDLPLWMKFADGTGNLYWMGTGGVSALSMKNGQLISGNDGGTRECNFITEFMMQRRSSSSQTKIYYGDIAGRNGSVSRITAPTNTSQLIVNDTINDVAMTVLPNAPIDAATGLPVPTIAVGTDAGVSVITDSGNVYDLSSTADGVQVAFDDDKKLWVMWNDASGDAIYAYPTSAYISSDFTNADGVFRFNDGGWSSGKQANTLDFDHLVTLSNNYIAFGGNYSPADYEGLNIHNDIAYPGAGTELEPEAIHANIQSDFNTGWMNGDIKLATLSDTDATNVTGSELLTNGDFATGNLTGWTDKSSGTGTATVNGSNQLELYRLDGSNVGWAQQAITTVSGSTYLLTVNEITDGGAIFIGSTDGGSDIYGASAASGINIVMFTATSTTTYVGLRGSGNGTTSVYDDVSVRLAEEDRSVNGNGLQVFGTVTKSAVSTGADLMQYDGWSGSNYLQQPYNSDLDFGTGDFCYMLWFANGTDYFDNNLIHRAGGNSVAGGVLIQSTGSYSMNLWANADGEDFSGVLHQFPYAQGVWNHLVFMRSNSRSYAYLNGKLVSTVSHTKNMNLPNAKLRIGGRHDSSTNYFRGDLALLRISATAPSPEQIAKIYEDEKVLFQENAQATLYGSSDAVTALAYDDTTELLHVGTSAGRSVFQGLRRVDNTTDAVGAAISASNGLVAED